jgi:hypothetical protein
MKIRERVAAIIVVSLLFGLAIIAAKVHHVGHQGVPKGNCEEIDAGPY